MHTHFKKHVFTVVICFIIAVFAQSIAASDVFTEQDLLNLKYVTNAEISPDGEWIAYTVRVPREPDDEPGSAYSELYLISVESGEVRPFIVRKESVKSIAWRPDGTAVGFRMKRGEDAKTQVWMIALAGGEARQLTHSETHVSEFAWHPTENKLAYLAETPPTAREKALKKKGYDFIYFEEEWKHRNLYMLDLDDKDAKAEQLTEGVTLWSFEFAPDGRQIAAGVSEKNLIDYRYVFQKVHLLDLETNEMRQLTDNPGKLGNYRFSPDGQHLAYAGALSQKDNAVSQVYVVPTAGGEAKNLTLPDFRGHVNWVAWKDNETVLYRSYEGVETTLSTVELDDVPADRDVILHSQATGVIFDEPSFTRDFDHFAFVGESPDFPGDVFYWNGDDDDDMERLTTVNPWLSERTLGKQEPIQYQVRDEHEIEGLLIYPVGYQEGQTYPLVVIVHGGPESNYSNEWVTNYSRPGQILAGKGYAAFYPNYRSSTGYGVDYAAWGYNEAAGVEFDDIADGIIHLVETGIADQDRVGLGGGSYGGFASAWFASRYTHLVKAVCMFVGISDLISKRGTTDIPYEELFVHSGKKLEEMWDQSLKRSPIYWAHQSETATLIYGGKEDTRVHPSQSLEFYRRLKMNDHPAVRLVQYPDEKHGNSKQPGRIDVLYRILDWYDWYVKDAKSLDGPMPPLDISDKYGLDLPE